MKSRRPGSDDVLFISALAAVLIGIGLLLRTTRPLEGGIAAWPILVMAAGGLLLYLALVRKSSIYILFGGMLFALEGAFFQAMLLAHWRLAQAWPLIMAVAGAAGVAAGIVRKQGRKAPYLVPSIGFLGLGLFFALFSFKWIKASFSEFIASWWPTAFIGGGICLFVAYGLARRKAARAAAESSRSASGAGAGKTIERPSRRSPDP